MIIRARFATTRGWLLSLAVASVFLLIFLISTVWLFYRGVGIWGINEPVGWGFAITNFVWWIGIGHAGTFISAILYLCHQQWRTAVSRLAETMTVFAVVCAGLFPILHLGRPWFFYWLMPYYDSMGLWPQFRSPLIWDLFAVLTYMTISVLFWFLGLVPDLASLRDRAPVLWQKRLYGIFALGWRGSREQWFFYKSAYLIFAGIATPLVISVHSIVSMDFSVGIIPGWHSTIFPPFFVAGAIYSGFAMVLTLAVLLRWGLKLDQVLTLRHFDMCARLTLAMSLLVGYGYMSETFAALFSNDIYELGQLHARYFGPYAPASWMMIFCNVILAQLLWFPRVRRSLKALFVISLLIQIGMWTERFVIVVLSLQRDFLPSSWHVFVPTIWDAATLFGSMGVFAFLYLLFARVAPVVATTELRAEPEFRETEFI